MPAVSHGRVCAPISLTGSVTEEVRDGSAVVIVRLLVSHGRVPTSSCNKGQVPPRSGEAHPQFKSRSSDHSTAAQAPAPKENPPRDFIQ